jgi:hypothetical protein
MKSYKVNQKAQFSIIAALLVAVVLIAAVITTYSAIRYSPLQEQPQVLSAIDETNLALKQILGFTIGYYGSVLKVTGNTSYARQLATAYLQSGLDNIADIRPEWGPSFNVTQLTLKTNWFTSTSYSSGSVTVKYDLTGLGVYGITYFASSRLDVVVSESSSTSQASLTILKDGDEPLVNLGSHNFDFYRYDYETSTWALINPTNITSYADGTYVMNLPSGVLGDSFVLQVEDSRGIVVTASSFSRYTITLAWDGNYSTIPNENMVIEMLQNGTMRWLGQNLNSAESARPIPPIPVKAIHVTQTINNVDQEVPFQIEDWASEYRNPLGMASATSLFSNRNMIVFLANSKTSKVTIWWNGSDDALQTSLAYQNVYFSDDTSGDGTLNNGKLSLTLPFDGNGNTDITSRVGSVTTSTYFMRINSEFPTYGSNLAYIIYNGVVRDIIHQEAEWSTGIPNCPNVYSQIVITLPATVNYYTYQLRLMFIDSEQSRTITDLTPIRLYSSSINQIQTENGTVGGFPVVASTTSGSASFYNYSQSTWEHHWSQFISGTGTGGGIMYTDVANTQLYAFDSLAGTATGTLRADSTNRRIELRPITSSTSFQHMFDVAWYGAVATFDSTKTPIYKLQGGAPSGLWILAEYPPAVSVTAET